MPALITFDSLTPIIAAISLTVMLLTIITMISESRENKLYRYTGALVLIGSILVLALVILQAAIKFALI